jgi:predicted acyltransferase (DUF342 family)
VPKAPCASISPISEKDFHNKNEGMIMKVIQHILLISMLIAASSAQANTPLLDSALNSQTVYSGAAITLGAGSSVGGNLQAVAAATLGANAEIGINLVAGAAVTLGDAAKVGGNVTARDAGTLGADSTVGGNFVTGGVATLGATVIEDNIMVGGDLTAGAAIFVGRQSVVSGDLTSGSGTPAELGALARVGGSAKAGTALTLGDSAVVVQHATAATGPLTLGANSTVGGDATAGTSITIAADATVGGDTAPESAAPFTNDPKGEIDNQQAQLSQAQVALKRMGGSSLATTMTTDTVLTGGIYHATALTTTAGITITLDDEGEGSAFVFNIDSYLAFGASTTIEVINSTPDTTVIWNTGGYTTIGADSIVIGTILAGSYVTTGEGTTLTGIDDACGGVFTTVAAVTLGADNIMGAPGCAVGAINNFIIEDDGIASFVVEKIASANAGPDQSVNEGDVVTLDGSESGEGSYVWRQFGLEEVADGQEGQGVFINFSNSINPNFTAPLVGYSNETISFEVAFTDANGTTWDVVNIIVKNVNTVPEANAGEDQTVTAGSPITLDGSLSSDLDGEDLSFKWTQLIDGIQVTLSDANSPNPSLNSNFTFTPENSGALGTSAIYNLTVSDGTVDSAVDSVTVTISQENNDPIAEAGVARVVKAGEPFILNGRGSSDPDGNTLTYFWTQVEGQSTNITRKRKARAKSVAPNATGNLEKLTYELKVTDSNGGTSTDQVTIGVQGTHSPPIVEYAYASSDCLRPPNKKLKRIKIKGIYGGASVIIDSVTQDEDPLSNKANHNIDAVVSVVKDEERLFLRAERTKNNPGNGRVYAINFTATNEFGSQTGRVNVVVPRYRNDQSCTAEDDGQHYTSYFPDGGIVPH